VFVAAIVGGSGPGLVATALCILSGNMLFMEPVGKVGPVLYESGFRDGLVSHHQHPHLHSRRLAPKENEALRESEARLKMAHRAARIGSFEWNLQTGVNVWSPELEAMYGLESGEFPRAGSAWEKLIHPRTAPKL
jgi:PAS domain-containing protein